ncbi:MAG: hypothetical protein KC609_02160 [Myxococcales bacterium]|nr:hypothetical protein [Myxococcales bacterium]
MNGFRSFLLLCLCMASLALWQTGCGKSKSTNGGADTIITGDGTGPDGDAAGVDDVDGLPPSDVTPQDILDGVDVLPNDADEDVSVDDQSISDGTDDQTADTVEEIVIPQICGNTIPEGNEECDDGNTDNLDGCLETCKRFEACGTFTAIEPSTVICDPQSTDELPKQLTIKGTFSKVNGVFPTVSFAGTDLTNVQFSDCAVPTELFQGLTNTPDVEICTTATFDLPAITVDPADYEIVVKKHAADLSSCSETKRSFSIGGKPTFTSIKPLNACSSGSKIFEIEGTGLTGGTQVVFTSGTLTYTPISQSLLANGKLRVTLAANVERGIYDVTIANGTGCEADATFQAVVANTPTFLFTDTPVTYTEISIQSTIYLSGLVIPPGQESKVKVWVKKENVDPQPTDCSGDPPPDGCRRSLVITLDPANPNLIQAIIPELSAGTYEVQVLDPSECTASLPMAFTVSATTVPTLLTGIDPSFGRTKERTPVTLIGNGFQNGARIYLSPASGQGLGSALTAVGFVDTTRMTAVVPEKLPDGLTPGYYEVVVVNPDGTIGLLGCTLDQGKPAQGAKCFTVTADPPPRIENISPGAMANQSGQKLVVEGSGFDPAKNPKVTLICNHDGTLLPTVTAVVDTSKSTTAKLETVVNMASVDHHSVCVVRVTLDDGSFDEFNGIAVTNPSDNIGDFTISPNLLKIARRAPATTSGRATRAARFLYAIGGDNGNSTTPELFDSIEIASLGRFGELGQWRMAPVKLPEGRTLARAVLVGRFIYLLGGSDGTGPLASVLRAKVLNPAEATVIKTVGLNVLKQENPTSELTNGVWYYRIAAVLVDDDAENPGGEELASDPQPVVIPEKYSKRIEVFLSWTHPLPEARIKGYRIYRTAAPNQTSKDTVLIASCLKANPNNGGQPDECWTALTFTDPGLAAILVKDANNNDVPVPPRQLGDIGEWNEVAELVTGRMGHSANVAHVKTDQVDQYFLYAILGQGNDTLSDVILKTYEVLPITINGDESHTLGVFSEKTLATTGTNPAAVDGLWLHDSGLANSFLCPKIAAGTNFIYVGDGSTTTGGLFANVSEVKNKNTCASLVRTEKDAENEIGDLDPCMAVNLGKAGVGYNLIVAANSLYMLAGGTFLTPSTSVWSVALCPDNSCQGSNPPFIANPTADGVKVQIARYLAGKALESAHIFLIGGQTFGGPTRQVESNLW